LFYYSAGTQLMYAIERVCVGMWNGCNDRFAGPHISCDSRPNVVNVVCRWFLRFLCIRLLLPCQVAL
jgi:hypothetical protein